MPWQLVEEKVEQQSIPETERTMEEVPIKIAPKKRVKLLPEQVVLEIKKTSSEVLQNLNSDDFGTTA